jgi:hypothetical protein
MELTILTALAVVCRVVAVSAAVVLPVAFYRTGELRSRRQTSTRPLSGAAGRRPESARANERALRISQVRWKLLL